MLYVFYTNRVKFITRTPTITIKKGQGVHTTAASRMGHIDGGRG